MPFARSSLPKYFMSSGPGGPRQSSSTQYLLLPFLPHCHPVIATAGVVVTLPTAGEAAYPQAATDGYLVCKLVQCPSKLQKKPTNWTTESTLV
jgi:hypothetical protein